RILPTCFEKRVRTPEDRDPFPASANPGRKKQTLGLSAGLEVLFRRIYQLRLRRAGMSTSVPPAPRVCARQSRVGTNDDYVALTRNNRDRQRESLRVSVVRDMPPPTRRVLRNFARKSEAATVRFLPLSANSRPALAPRRRARWCRRFQMNSLRQNCVP